MKGKGCLYSVSLHYSPDTCLYISPLTLICIKYGIGSLFFVRIFLLSSLVLVIILIIA